MDIIKLLKSYVINEKLNMDINDSDIMQISILYKTNNK